MSCRPVYIEMCESYSDVMCQRPTHMPSAPHFPPDIYFATDSLRFPKCEKCGINNLDDSHLTGLILIGGKREGDDP